MATSETQKSTGSKRTALAKSDGRSKDNSGVKDKVYPYFAVCLRSKGYEGSLITGKIYQVIRPEKNDPAADVRVIDEEGEDYLYAADRFVPVELPVAARKALRSASLLRA